MITIGIPSAGRIDKLLQCIESININTQIDCTFVIVDNSINSISSHERLSNSDIQVVRPQIPLSPSASRELIGSIATTEYILYIDEDMTVSKKSLDRLYDFLVHNESVSVVGGFLIEGMYEYPIAYKFGFGYKKNQKNIWKIPIRKSGLIRLGIDKCQSDFIHPPFLVRSKVLKNTSFDKNYKWGGELLDFFVDCYNKDITVMSLTDVPFFHFPGEYVEKTHKSNIVDNNIMGKNYFQKKWNLRIVSPKITMMEFFIERIKKRIWFNLFRSK